MRSPLGLARRFVAVARRDGLGAALRATGGKVRRRLWPAGVGPGSPSALEGRLADLEGGVVGLQSAELAERVQRLEEAQRGVQAQVADLFERAGRLAELLERVEQTARVLDAHSRSLVSVAELLGHLPPAGSPARGTPLISVIMPTRNRAEWLRSAIASLQAQTWVDWELVVVDDGSDDDTPEVLAAAAAADPRIRSHRQDRAGHALARNAALAVASGEVITYLDDDNEYYPGYLQAVAAAYQADPGLELAYAGQLWAGAALATLVTFDRFSWEHLRDQRASIDTNVVSHRVGLYHRLGGFDPALQRHADLDLVLRYAGAVTPQRIPVMAVRYSWDALDRVTDTRSSAAALHRISEKYATPAGRGVRALVLGWDYPQLSESYIHTEIRWMLSRGVEVEVFAMRRPVSPGQPIVPVGHDGITAAVERFDPHLIHVHWLSLAAENAAELARIGLPVTVRGHGFDHTPELAASLLAEPWLAHMYLFGNLPPPAPGHRAKVRQVDVAFDTSRYYPVTSKDRRLVLRAGACLPTKDLGLFLEVAARCPDYRFVLALSRNASGAETEQELVAMNERLGRPAEILIDVQYEEMGELMRSAGVYLHTFGFVQPFAQPISISEAMASGTVPLIRRSAPSQQYGGEVAHYYDDADEAVAILEEMRQWDDARWERASQLAVERAYSRYADSVVLQPVLDDWIALAANSSR